MDLQLLLEQHDELLGGEQIHRELPRRWLLVKREQGIPNEDQGADWWSVDQLFLDQDAVPTFIEVKRSSDSRLRREVVAQMLDYAANAQQYWPVDRLRADHARRCVRAGLEPESEIADLLGGGDSNTFWEQAHRNLTEGRVRLLFVADAIPSSLRTIIEFLNRQMASVEVLGSKSSSLSARTRTLTFKRSSRVSSVRQSKQSNARNLRNH